MSKPTLSINDLIGNAISSSADDMKKIIQQAFIDSGKDRKKFNHIVMTKTGLSKRGLEHYLTSTGYNDTLKFTYDYADQ
mgnify:CR=1 FL=1